MADIHKAMPALQQSLRPAKREHRKSSLFARGETMIWLTGGALVLCLMMIVGLMVLVFGNGLGAFWPQPIVRVKLQDGSVHMGSVNETDRFLIEPAQYDALPEAKRKRVDAGKDEEGTVGRTKIRTANYDLTSTHFTWIEDFEIVERDEPEWAVAVERLEWGRFYGLPKAFVLAGERQAESPEAAWAAFEEHHQTSRERFEAISELEDEAGELDGERARAVLNLKAIGLKKGESSPEYEQAADALAKTRARLDEAVGKINERIAKLRRKNDEYQLVLQTADGREKSLVLAEIVRAFRPNVMDVGDKMSVYSSRWWEFLWDYPRESNSEGGVWPAIFGTVIMTLIMTLLVVPFGVLAALYLREYAKQGTLVSIVRIAVGNLAGVPSIVFGVFGLGLFCYILGGGIDQVFFEERLPNPTYGKGGLLWASLTLALLTLPVVIVATEEALAAVPNSMREGSYACGASKWQTIRRIVLPRAAPGILTGTILAIARGAGEVAPLMLVGAVKYVKELPIDTAAPFVHPERSFMHLGFHIYDLALQTSNSVATRPMVFSTTVLLIGIVLVLNIVAIWVRARLRRAFEV